MAHFGVGPCNNCNDHRVGALSLYSMCDSVDSDSEGSIRRTIPSPSNGPCADLSTRPRPYRRLANSAHRTDGDATLGSQDTVEYGHCVEPAVVPASSAKAALRQLLLQVSRHRVRPHHDHPSSRRRTAAFIRAVSANAGGCLDGIGMNTRLGQ